MSKLVRKTYKVEGVPTTVTSAVLSDPTGTYGVKRNDTNVVVTADGTAMTEASTGQYEYTFDEPEAGLAYTAYVEFVRDGLTTWIEADFPIVAAGASGVITHTTLRLEIADFLGWTRSSGNWDTDEDARLDEVLHSGYRQFVYPVLLEGESVVHRWSFLQPTAPFDTEADVYLYDMPSTFGAIVGDLVYDEDEYVRQVIEQTTPGVIDRNRAINSASGRPYQFALRPKSLDMTAAQVTELMLYPTPGAIYGIVYHYDAKVDPLSGSNLYPLGGQAHSETILQSCRDIAATRYKDQPAGPEHALFLERLRASVEADRRLSPKTLGFNNDGRKFIHTRHGTDFTVTHGSM